MSQLQRSASDPMVTHLVSGQSLPCDEWTTSYVHESGGKLGKVLQNCIRRDMCAYLNCDGGRILIGVDQDGVVHGFACSREDEEEVGIYWINNFRCETPMLLCDQGVLR